MRKVFASVVLILAPLFAKGQLASVSGVVSDADMNDFLIGAVVLQTGTTNGAVVDVNGHYQLSVPSGKTSITCEFLGYQTQVFNLQLKAGESMVLNIQMHSDSQVLDGVVVSAQAKGQMAAINSQLRSSSIINAVSSEKLSELPDVNVADAVGRLPGLMIQRDGGEGQKVVIRGLSPEFNTVSINGMNAPASGETDRSTDLNMISPDMIAGAEVYKANTADKDADGIGGTVNLILKEAPSGHRLSVNGETGYHTKINGIGRTKIGTLYSNRFFNEKLGVIASASYDNTDRSNDAFDVSFNVSGDAPTPGYSYNRPTVSSEKLQANRETRVRWNANVNLDYDLGGGNKIKMSNIVSSLNRNRLIRTRNIGLSSNQMTYSQQKVDNTTTNLSNVLEGIFHVSSSTLNIGVGHSSTWNRTPYSRAVSFYYEAPLAVSAGTLQSLHPFDVMEAGNFEDIDMSKYYFYNAHDFPSESYERESSAWVDWKTPFMFSPKIKGYVKVGAKARLKNRDRNSSDYCGTYYISAVQAFNSLPDLERSSRNYPNMIGIGSFLDNNYSPRASFMNGRCPGATFDFSLDESFIDHFFASTPDTFYQVWGTNIADDYSCREGIYAGYVMAELNVGSWLTFLPGVRYDYTTQTYNGLCGEGVKGTIGGDRPGNIFEKNNSQKYGYLLPQIHLKISPSQWCDVRMAYTQTLSRPDYNDLVPRYVLSTASASIQFSDTNLKPILSTNYDLTVSFYPQNWGLFSVSGFHKNISNFIYTTTSTIADGSDTPASAFGLSSAYNGYLISRPINGASDATVSGVEFDAQFNFHHLSNPFLKGMVLSFNGTYMTSRMNYYTSELSKSVVGGKIVHQYKDIAYHDRLLKQPELLMNASIGYDYKKFSIRFSCNYQDGVLKTAQRRADAADKVITSPFVKLDTQVKYKLNKHLSFYLSASNISMSMDEAIRYVTGYPQSITDYGATAYIGIKYDILK